MSTPFSLQPEVHRLTVHLRLSRSRDKDCKYFSIIEFFYPERVFCRNFTIRVAYSSRKPRSNDV
ncbi:hypothetical protein WN48_04018 [Eufriesea mexicana]|uniref:Uncharacterized protein n=1 Tax=Eufriesea mexicana TaxID=516756 RepID=A0A310SEI3_9HYME|nr:hypothetical protein WN48_04018 [Eufriesea mexicana]